MKEIAPIITIFCSCIVAVALFVVRASNSVAALPSAAVAAEPAEPAPAPLEVELEQFTFTAPDGQVMSAPLVDDSARRKLTKPIAKIDPTLDPALARAATIAQERANAHSKAKCWRYVKEALLAAGAVDSYPKTALAKEAADELVNDYGFERLSVTDPYAAPVGAVLVYTAKGAPGHVELRTRTGFVSDFQTETPSKRKLVGIYAKG